MLLDISQEIELAALTIADAEELLVLINDSRKLLQKYLYWVHEVQNITTMHSYISQRINSGLNGAMWFKIQYQGLACGVFAVKSIDAESGVAEIGYWLAGNSHKKGIISLVIQYLKGFLALYHNVKTIEIHCLDKNIASINVAIKAGAQLVRSQKNFLLFDGQMQDLQVYQIQL